jgi:hypothetical protein
MGKPDSRRHIARRIRPRLVRVYAPDPGRCVDTLADALRRHEQSRVTPEPVTQDNRPPNPNHRPAGTVAPEGGRDGPRPAP